MDGTNGTVTSGPAETRATLVNPGQPLTSGEVASLVTPGGDDISTLRQEVQELRETLKGVVAFREGRLGDVREVPAASAKLAPKAAIQETTLRVFAVGLVSAAGAGGVPYGTLLSRVCRAYGFRSAPKAMAALKPIIREGALHTRNANLGATCREEQRFFWHLGPDTRPRYKGKSRGVKNVRVGAWSKHKTPKTTPRVKKGKAEPQAPANWTGAFPGQKKTTPPSAATQGVTATPATTHAEPAPATPAPARAKRGGRTASTGGGARPERLGPSGRLAVPLDTETSSVLMGYARSEALRTGRSISLARAASDLISQGLAVWKYSQATVQRSVRKGT